MTGTTSAETRIIDFQYRSRRHGRGSPHGCDDDDVVVSRAVAAAQRGDRDAVRYLYVRYADLVQRSVSHILRDPHEAEDVTQQVFAKLFGSIGRYEQRAMPFRAWLLRVARNVALDTLRARRCVPASDVELPAREVHPVRSSMPALRDALQALPEDQRNVVYLRHVLGLSPVEIAERLGKSESAVHGLHHRGRLAIRRELEQMQAAPSTRQRTAS